MQLDHPLEEHGLGAHDVFNCLTGNRLRQKADEIAGMPRLEGNADLALRFEATYARTVPCARVDNDEWALGFVDLNSAAAVQRAPAHS